MLGCWSVYTRETFGRLAAQILRHFSPHSKSISGTRRWERGDRLECNEPLFEERVEVTWDKGSSGLVWHTDAARRDEDRLSP